MKRTRVLILVYSMFFRTMISRIGLFFQSCHMCGCVHGMLRCDPVRCPPVNCAVPTIQPPGQCCPICTSKLSITMRPSAWTLLGLEVVFEAMIPFRILDGTISGLWRHVQSFCHTTVEPAWVSEWASCSGFEVGPWLGLQTAAQRSRAVETAARKRWWGV